MKIAFVQAPAWGRDCPPYTMCLLAALIRQKGHQAYLFDLNNTLYHTSSRSLKNNWDNKDCYSFWEDRGSVCAFLQENKRAIDFYVDKILKTDSRIIGFTVHFSSVWASLEIARLIKERDKNRIIVFGGPDCSRQQKGDYLIQQDCVDVVVHGEGETPLCEIIDNLDGIKGLNSLKGCLLLRDGRICDGGYVAGPQDLDSLPLPDYSDFKDEIKLRMYREPNRLDIFDSRGCITHCHFCSEWQFWGKFRSKSGQGIYREIVQHMQDFPQVKYFYFIGSLVNGNIEALEGFCDLVIANNLKIEWAGQAIIRPEMSEGLLRKMKRSGCAWLSYGIESGSQKVLDKMNKHFSLEIASRVLADTKKAGIATQANFMFGLPTETLDDFKQTLEFLKDNRKYMDTILASQSFCVIDKGTYLYNHPEEFGIKNKEHHLYWESNNGENSYPERLRRYEEFCRLALSLGVPETSGVLRNKPNKQQLLDDYLRYVNDKESKLNSGYEEPADYSLIESAQLSEILQYYAKINYKGVDLTKIFSDFDFNEKQQSMCNVLYSHGLMRKLSNYILVDVQKKRREAVLFGYPYWLVIDPCNYCDLSCPFCPTGQKREARTKKQLSFQDYKSIIDKLGPYLIHIDLVNWGEPLLNEKIFEMISYAKRYRADIKIDTNMNHLDEKGIEKLILSGLDKIVVSIDGLSQESYAKYRIGGNFGLAMNNLKLLVKKRKELKKAKPYITWQFLVFRHNEHEVQEALRLGQNLGVDHVGITKAFIGEKDWMPLDPQYCNYDADKINDKDLTFNYFKSDADALCNWPWEAVAINTNGSVSPCCSVEEEKDDFGNIFSLPFEDFWNKEKYQAARNYIRHKEHNAPNEENVCAGCRHAGLINIDILSCHSFFDLEEVK
ncbi:MAG: radical SAM protein [Candidatus Omnitrophica bacterium]|nr:radical SAM protein [Candidatus Omnitrophota bacterium]